MSNRDFSRVTKPLEMFGANIKSKNNMLPITILGTNYLRPVKYKENIGSAQVKTCIIFSALNTPGITEIYSKSSRNHTELMLKFLNYPIKVIKKPQYEKIIVQGTIETALFALKYGVGMNIAGGTHHAFSNKAEAFCLLNDQSIAANFLINNNNRLKHSIRINNKDKYF